MIPTRRTEADYTSSVRVEITLHDRETQSRVRVAHLRGLAVSLRSGVVRRFPQQDCTLKAKESSCTAQAFILRTCLCLSSRARLRPWPRHATSRRATPRPSTRAPTATPSSRPPAAARVRLSSPWTERESKLRRSCAPSFHFSWPPLPYFGGFYRILGRRLLSSVCGLHQAQALSILPHQRCVYFL